MTSAGGLIRAISVAHDRADLDDLESADVESQRGAVADLLENPGVHEALVLQTCNRVEAYVAVEDPEVGDAALAPLVADVADDVVRDLDHEASLRHLLRVASGLESQIIGEDQILGQVRDAMEDARSAGGIGPVLEDGVTKAIHVGERARTETAINEGAVSLASAAVREADAVGDLEDATAVIVGAGEMGRQAATALSRAADRLIVANRTVPHAAHVAETVDAPAEAISLESLEGALGRADVAVTATGSPDPVVTRETLDGAGETVLVDIAQPRDVAPAAAEVEGVTVRDLDDLETHTAETLERRRAAATTVEEMIDEALDRLLAQYKRKRADRVISAMYEGAERIKAEELETALGKLDLDDEEAEIVEAMADAIVSQLLAAPTDSLRDAAEADDWSTIHTALQLFDPSDVNPDAMPEPADVDGAAIPPEVRDDLPPAIREQLGE